MNWVHSSLVTGRLLLILLSPVLWALVISHTAVLRAHPRNIWIRSASTVLAALCYFGVIVAQILIFSRIEKIQRVTNDDIAFLILLFENIISLGLLFSRLKKKDTI